MNKKTNTILFILGGTVFNIIVTVLCFVGFILIFTKFAPQLPENSAVWMLPLVFVTAVTASFLIYRAVVKIIMKKVNMEKYFDPIFGPRKPPRAGL